ncbi:hypothetical protein D3C80_1890000 [compost metagenome]
MAAWLALNGRDKRAAHQYDAAAFGLDEARLQRDYGEYRARHGVQLDANGGELMR